MELDIYYYLETKDMISFATGLDILYEWKAIWLMLFLTIMQKSKIKNQFLAFCKNFDIS